MKFLSEDGKVFSSANACKEHEAKCNANKEREERLEEIEKKWVAIDKLMSEVDDLIDAYIEDFPSCYKDLNHILTQENSLYLI